MLCVEIEPRRESMLGALRVNVSYSVGISSRELPIHVKQMQFKLNRDFYNKVYSSCATKYGEK